MAGQRPAPASQRLPAGLGVGAGSSRGRPRRLLRPPLPTPCRALLSISEERLKMMKIFSGKLCSDIASQEEGKAWM